MSWGIFAWRGKSAAQTCIYEHIRFLYGELRGEYIRSLCIEKYSPERSAFGVAASASKWVPNANILARFSAYSR
jgi:hypothetical protein